MHRTELSPDALAVLRRGAVIPAHLLALDANRRLDERRQRALARYYLDAGSGGLAVGVHAAPRRRWPRPASPGTSAITRRS